MDPSLIHLSYIELHFTFIAILNIFMQCSLLHHLSSSVVWFNLKPYIAIICDIELKGVYPSTDVTTMAPTTANALSSE